MPAQCPALSSNPSSLQVPFAPRSSLQVQFADDRYIMPVSPDRQKCLRHLTLPSTQPSSSTSPDNKMKEQWTTNNQLLLEDQYDQHGTAEYVRYCRPACVYAVNLPLQIQQKKHKCSLLPALSKDRLKEAHHYCNV